MEPINRSVSFRGHAHLGLSDSSLLRITDRGDQ